MMKEAIQNERLYGHFSLFVDHKQFFFQQGDCFGLLGRLTYYPDDDKESVMVLMGLVQCDPSRPDKSQQRTAQIIKEFLEEIDLWRQKNQGKLSITADHAISATLGQHLRALGWENIQNVIGICNSHTEQLKLKRTESEFNELVEFDDLEGKYNEILS